MEIVETWYFQIWVNFGGMADLLLRVVSRIPRVAMRGSRKICHRRERI